MIEVCVKLDKPKLYSIVGRSALKISSALVRRPEVMKEVEFRI